MESAAAASPPFPGLREDLRFHAGPRTRHGAPTWTLHDPARHRFFRLGRAEMEIMQRLDRDDPDVIAGEVLDTGLAVTPDDVAEVIRFLTGNHLVHATGVEGLERLRRQAVAGQRHWAVHLLHTYLFFRIPLLQPDHLLSRFLPWVAWMFSKGFLLLLSLAGLLGLHLVGRQWEAFFATFSHLFTWRGMLLMALTISLVKIAHELGHACAAKRYGCRVPTMGIAFLVMWPVLYTDTTDAWKLVSRRQRLVISGAGMLAEMTLAVLATLAWSFLPEGPLRGAVFFVATTSWLVTLTINLSPFLRFDGYYLLADWLGMDNLHERAAAMGRWWLRRVLFGWRQPCPESLSTGLRRFLILFAYATWLYRLILFLGIAMLVYHFFFKLAGVFLFAVEIGWFIALPIGRELGYWMNERRNLELNAHTIATSIVAVLLLLLAITPWSTRVEAPAVLRKARHATLFSQVAGRVETLSVAAGDPVREGGLLLRIDAPDLTYELAQVERRIEISRWQISFLGMNSELAEPLPIIRQELEASLTERRGLLEKAGKRTLTAPFSGTVTHLAPHLKPGDWIDVHEPLLELVHDGGWLLEAYVEESDLGRLGTGAAAVFHPENPEWPPLEATLVQIDAVGVRALKDPWLASVFEGGIPVREGEDGAWIPERSIYRVLLTPREESAEWRQLLRGTAILEGSAQSLVARAWKSVVAVLVRESGF